MIRYGPLRHAISDWERRPRRLRHILTSSVAHKSPASADLSVEEDWAVLHHVQHHIALQRIPHPERLRELVLIDLYGEHTRKVRRPMSEDLALRFAQSPQASLFLMALLVRNNSLPTPRP
jgi:hypothetical protein